MPPARYGKVVKQSRLRAALSRLRPPFVVFPSLMVLLLPLALAGCASGGTSPLGAMLQDTWGGKDDLAARAAEISFASLALEAEDRSGLVVLGALAGPQSFWPTGNQGLITLRHEGLHATAGLEADLLDTRYSLNTGEADVPWRLTAPPSFSLTRTWQHENGLTEQLSAEGTLTCSAPGPVELPLATLNLESCEMHLQWENGQRTRGQLWRDPQTLRLWAGQEQAWPNGPTLGWRVARPWW